MITRAEITSIDTVNNTCIVNVPLFENPDDSFPPQVTDVAMSVPPGVVSGYAVGDKVFVDFEENTFNKPVIIGKLYNSAAAAASIMASINDALKKMGVDKEKDMTTIICQSLQVGQDAMLPGNTIVVYDQNIDPTGVGQLSTPVQPAVTTYIDKTGMPKEILSLQDIRDVVLDLSLRIKEIEDKLAANQITMVPKGLIMRQLN